MARLLNKFLASASVVAGLSGVFGASAMAATISVFMSENWFHRFSDPNVESVTKNGRYVSFDLSGHLNYEDKYGSLKMSEVVMVNDQIFYAFGDAIDSGVNNGDEQSSHSGIHAFTYKIPEPSAVLGLMAIGGMVAATKRRAQK